MSCLILSCLLILDAYLLYATKGNIEVDRSISDKLSNGDSNKIQVRIKNHFRYKINIVLIDEIPFQFQKRDFELNLTLDSKEEKEISYFLTPKKRGVYHFGVIQTYVSSPVSIFKRRIKVDLSKEVKVYPSFIQMQKLG